MPQRDQDGRVRRHCSDRPGTTKGLPKHRGRATGLPCPDRRRRPATPPRGAGKSVGVALRKILRDVTFSKPS
eukprot:5490695-Prymnesium_polylepis.2